MPLGRNQRVSKGCGTLVNGVQQIVKMEFIFLNQLYSAQNGIYALRKPNMRSTPSLGGFPQVLALKRFQC